MSNMPSRIERLFEAFAKKKINEYHLPYKFNWIEDLKKPDNVGFTNMGNKTINMSRAFVHAARKSANNILYHEIAHAITAEKYGYMDHDDLWKGICWNIDALPNKTTYFMVKKGRWAGTCPNCGTKTDFGWQKKNAVCLVCQRRYGASFSLKWKYINAPSALYTCALCRNSYNEKQDPSRYSHMLEWPVCLDCWNANKGKIY